MRSVISQYSSSGTRSMSTTYASWTLTAPVTTFTGLELGGLWIFVNTISSATEITWKITRDSAGDEALTPEYTETLVTGQTTATDGSIANALQLPLPSMGSVDLKTIYLWVKTDAGTCTGSEARISVTVPV